MTRWIDWNHPSLFFCLASIAFNPTAWNIVARNEYHNKTMTRLFGGNARRACFVLAVLIFSFGLLRDSLYHRALAAQPTIPILPNDPPLLLHITLPLALFISGQTLVLTSTFRLGITGTFLGDYFGILMDARVEGFPFNVVRDPMYVGSTLCFAATALWYEKPAGLIITLYVYLAYVIALRYEGPFTDMIYAKRERSREKSRADSAADSEKKEL